MPLVRRRTKLEECKAPAEKYKCINFINYNRYSKSDKIIINHSSLHRDCPSLPPVLAKYRLNTD